MEIVIGLIIIAIGAFCQSSCYVPINKIKDWSWESYWIVQGVFAWLLLPLLGALLAVPAGHSLFELFTAEQSFNIWMTILFGVLWGVGGLTFGLSMRYLGVALGQSIALGTCAGLGTIMGPVLLNIFFPEQDPLSKLTFSVILGVVVTLVGIAIIGVAGSMKSAGLSEEEKKAAVKDFNFPKGLTIALLAGFMSGCFNVGLTFGADIKFAETQEMFAGLPATFLVTLGGFPSTVSIRTRRTRHGATIRKAMYGATMWCSVCWPVPCGIHSSSDSHWVRASSRKAAPCLSCRSVF